MGLVQRGGDCLGIRPIGGVGGHRPGRGSRFIPATVRRHRPAASRNTARALTYQASPQGTLFDTVPVPANEAELREKRVRARLNGWLDMVRTAEKMPWDRLDAEKHETLRTAFTREMERLRALR